MIKRAGQCLPALIASFTSGCCGLHVQAVTLVAVTAASLSACRPDFGAVFDQLERDNPGGKIGVFYCGNPGLGSTLRALALAASERRCATFIFRQEHF